MAFGPNMRVTVVMYPSETESATMRATKAASEGRRTGRRDRLSGARLHRARRGTRAARAEANRRRRRGWEEPPKQCRRSPRREPA